MTPERIAEIIGWNAIVMESEARREPRGLSARIMAAIKEAEEAERIKHQAEIQRLIELANTAEKWRGIAMSRDGDGRTVQEVWSEAVAAEREACAKACEQKGKEWCGRDPRRQHHTGAGIGALKCADIIRARGGK